MPDEKQSNQTETQSVLDDLDDLEHTYANNVAFESSIWDLKMLFGQLESHRQAGRVNWHTAVSIPWIQAKLVSYYLQLNLAAYEEINGPIQIPEGVQPPLPEIQAEYKKLHKLAEDLYTRMFP